MKKIILLALITLVLFSCKEADTTAPKIVVATPQQNAAVKAGEELCIQVTFTDDVALNSYKINIHPNFNGHAHNKIGQTSPGNTIDFETTITSESRNDKLSGKECFRDIDIDIPDNATTGKYHLLIYCTDLAGNEAYIAQDLSIE